MDLRSNEIKEKIQSLAKELQGIKDKVDKDEREFTPEEIEKATKLADELDAMELSLEAALAEERTNDKLVALRQPAKQVVRPDVGKTSPSDGLKFRSFGEQLVAVARYYATGEMNYKLRAATGMSEGVPSDGGFLVQTDFAADLVRRVYETGQVVSKMRRIPISGNANGLKINAVAETSRAAGSRWGGIVAYWLSEAGTKSTSYPKFRQMELSLKKLIGLCYATDELLQDATALEAVIRDGFAEEFAFMLDDAGVNGTGVGQPLGIMNAACRVQVTRNTASHVYSEDIVAMWARMWAKSRPKAVWFINQDVEPELFKLNLGGGTAGSGVILTYMPPGGLSQAPYGTMMGRPVIPIEQCQTLGTSGDIILADFNEYLLIEKGGMQSASSIHVAFATDQTAQTNEGLHHSNMMVNSSLIQGNLSYARA